MERAKNIMNSPELLAEYRRCCLESLGPRSKLRKHITATECAKLLHCGNDTLLYRVAPETGLRIITVGTQHIVRKVDFKAWLNTRDAQLWLDKRMRYNLMTNANRSMLDAIAKGLAEI